MRIAIVTVYDSIINYGSFLQAYSLSEYLKQLGHNVFFVRRMSDDEIMTRFNKLAIKQNTVPEGKKLRWIRQMKKNPIMKIEQKNNEERFVQSKRDWEALEFINPEDVNPGNIDLIICGSDEIWNVHNDDIDVPFYTCDWADVNVRKIAYAISAGNTLPQEASEKLQNDITKFEYLLPRDNMTQQLFDKLLGVKSDIVCDPTILLGKKYFKINTDSKFGRYMLVYSYGLSRLEKRYIKRFAKEKKLEIISPCIYSDIADKNVFTSALEFPSIINNAEYVYTTTFHGTIFSLMFAKHFACKARLPKIVDVINACGAASVIFNPSFSYEQFAKLMDQDIDHDAIENNMNTLREFSRGLLLKGINGEYDKIIAPVDALNGYPKYYMGITKNEKMRAKSSSGGIFYELATETLSKGGIVFGAMYDASTQQVHHANTDDVSLEFLMRSKYVESDIMDSYSQVLANLERGRQVLFSGTPCQVAGLRRLVNIKAKDKEKQLLLVDFLCEGVPSKNIFGAYQKMHEKRSGSRVNEVIFRSKAYGWVPHAMKVVFENGKEYVAPYFMDEYMHTFINDCIFNRPSCYYCHFRQEKLSDITLGDFWKVDKVDEQMDDNMGTSVIFANTLHGQEVFLSLSEKLDCKQVVDNTRFYMEQHLDLAPVRNKRDAFYEYMYDNGFDSAIAKYSTYYKNLGVKARFNYIKYLIKLEWRRRAK